jgi:hypothetical protein
MNASAAALARLNAPWMPSLRATASTLSMPISALSAVLALALAPLVLLFRANYLKIGTLTGQ